MRWGAIASSFKDPIILGLLVMFLALAVTLVRKRYTEGWTFEGREDKMSKKHRDEVVKLCKSGWTFGQIVGSSKDYLAKYDKKEVETACKEGTVGRADLMAIGADTSGCKHGPCPVLTMRASRPCLNKAKTKCCNSKYKDCRNPQEAGITNSRYIKAEQKEDEKDRQRLSAFLKSDTTKAEQKEAEQKCPASNPCPLQNQTKNGKKLCWHGDQPHNKGYCCPNAHALKEDCSRLLGVFPLSLPQLQEFQQQQQLQQQQLQQPQQQPQFTYYFG